MVAEADQLVEDGAAAAAACGAAGPGLATAAQVDVGEAPDADGPGRRARECQLGGRAAPGREVGRGDGRAVLRE